MDANERSVTQRDRQYFFGLIDRAYCATNSGDSNTARKCLKKMWSALAVIELGEL